jgi:membrane fusion protein (multidrug efflux system)
MFLNKMKYYSAALFAFVVLSCGKKDQQQQPTAAASCCGDFK